MAGPVRQDLFLAPGRHITKCLALNKPRECRLVRPFTGDQVRRVIADIFPQRRTGMAFSGVERIDDASELLLKILLFAFEDVVIHANSDHVRVYSLNDVNGVMREIVPRLSI